MVLAPEVFARLLLAATRKQLVDLQVRGALAAAEKGVADALLQAGLDPTLNYALDEATRTARAVPCPTQEPR